MKYWNLGDGFSLKTVLNYEFEEREFMRNRYCLDYIFDKELLEVGYGDDERFLENKLYI